MAINGTNSATLPSVSWYFVKHGLISGNFTNLSDQWHRNSAMISAGSSFISASVS